MQHMNKLTNQYFLKYLRFYSKKSTCSFAYCNKDVCFYLPGCKKYTTFFLLDDYDFDSVRHKNNTSIIANNNSPQYKELDTIIGLKNDIDIPDNYEFVESKKIHVRSLLSSPALRNFTHNKPFSSESNSVSNSLYSPSNSLYSPSSSSPSSSSPLSSSPSSSSPSSSSPSTSSYSTYSSSTSSNSSYSSSDSLSSSYSSSSASDSSSSASD